MCPSGFSVIPIVIISGQSGGVRVKRQKRWGILGGGCLPLKPPPTHSGIKEIMQHWCNFLKQSLKENKCRLSLPSPLLFSATHCSHQSLVFWKDRTQTNTCGDFNCQNKDKQHQTLSQRLTPHLQLIKTVLQLSGKPLWLTIFLQNGNQKLWQTL